MKSKKGIVKRISAILLALTILSCSAGLYGCDVSGSDEEESTISVEKETSNKNIFAKADNNIDVAVISSCCTLSDFNKYNIASDVYSRITTAIYISDIESDIGIPVLRKLEDNYYSVHPIKTDNGTLLYGFILYSNNGKVIDGWCNNKLLTVDDFLSLERNSKLSEVNKIDPYNCFVENISENSATSYHKLADGKQYVIDYKRENENSEYTLSYARVNDDPVKFTNIMLEIDRRLIAG